MSQEYDPQEAEEASPETGERHQLIVKEFPDKQSGLLAELYHYRENVNNVVRSSSTVYIEDGYRKAEGADFLDGHTKDVFVDNLDELYVGVYETDDGYWVEVGEGDGTNDLERTILYATAYTVDGLDLVEIDIDTE